jgi:gluconokinase
MQYKLELGITAMLITANLTDENGVETRETVPYPGMVFPTDDLYAETVFDTMVSAYRQIDSRLTESDILAEVSFSFVANGWLAMDADFKSLAPIMNGAHEHAAKYVDALTINGIGGQLQRKSGVTLTETTPLVLTLWLKNELPDAFAKTVHYLGMAEYFRYRLLGKLVMNEANAARTGFYNLVTQEWDKQALALAGLTADSLPQVVGDATELVDLPFGDISKGLNQ